MEMTPFPPNKPGLDKWPKSFPLLTPEQEQISNDFMKYWHQVLPAKYEFFNNFNHQYVIDNTPTDFLRTLEIGAGDGEHIKYERLTDLQRNNYFAVDIRENMIESLRKRFPEIQSSLADCQKRMNFDDDYFDRILAIHVLEHLPNLPAAVREIHRVCNKDNGVLSVVIPCEGSLAYGLARKISAERIFKRRYKQPYRWFIEREHVSVPAEIIEELTPYFTITSSTYFPIPIKLEICNLCIGLSLRPRRLSP